MPQRQPRAASSLPMAATSGDLPAPPTTTLPTTITRGGPWRDPRAARIRRRRDRETTAVSASSGRNRRPATASTTPAEGRNQTRASAASTRSRRNSAMGRSARAAVGGEGDAFQPGATRRVEHRDDRLVRGAGVGIDHQHRRLRSEEHTSELQSRENLVCRLLLEKKKELE